MAVHSYRRTFGIVNQKDDYGINNRKSDSGKACRLFFRVAVHRVQRNHKGHETDCDKNTRKAAFKQRVPAQAEKQAHRKGQNRQPGHGCADFSDGSVHGNTSEIIKIQNFPVADSLIHTNSYIQAYTDFPECSFIS
ncbi:hypothetical protein SDC9_200958 [bioreactor metagenome]|uniref:Uncharacterized protein n=1 Tax=bioreactor metagenome TaxID=1076179 RepID=A0A645IYD7_9ZZZZ